MIHSDERINEIVLEAHSQLNEKFVKEAMSQWAQLGRGCPHEWLKVYVIGKWLGLVRSN